MSYESVMRRVRRKPREINPLYSDGIERLFQKLKWNFEEAERSVARVGVSGVLVLTYLKRIEEAILEAHNAGFLGIPAVYAERYKSLEQQVREVQDRYTVIGERVA